MLRLLRLLRMLRMLLQDDCLIFSRCRFGSTHKLSRNFFPLVRHVVHRIVHRMVHRVVHRVVHRMVHRTASCPVATVFFLGQRILHLADQRRLKFLRIPLNIPHHGITIRGGPTTGRKNAGQPRERFLRRPRRLSGFTLASALCMTNRRNIRRICQN